MTDVRFEDPGGEERRPEVRFEDATLVGGRECGPCQLCCKIMAIDELEKPRNVWCPWAQKAGPGKGCGCYSVRPEACRTFECGWLAGLLPESMRPDRIHGFVTPTTDGEGIIIHEDPGYKGDASAALSFFTLQVLQTGSPVIVACGESRKLLLADPAKIKALLDAQGTPDRPDSSPSPDQAGAPPLEPRPGDTPVPEALLRDSEIALQRPRDPDPHGQGPLPATEAQGTTADPDDRA